MDIGRVLTRAWEITWRWKILWVLGFLAALGQGTGTANSSYRFAGRDFQSGNLPNFNMPAQMGGLIIALACLAFIIAIALFVISVVARAGLIAGVSQVETQGSTTLGQAWAAGQRRFWTMFGIGILAVLPVILLVAAMVIGAIVLAGGAAALAGGRGNEAAAPVIAILLACVLPSICITVIVGALLGQIRIYAERAAVLEDLGWIDAFRRGWQVLRANLGSTILLWIVFLVLGVVVGAITLAILLPVLLPIFALLGANTPNSTMNWQFLVPICGLGLVGTVVGAIVGSIIQTFTSATWTLAYRQMTGPGARVVEPSQPLVEG